MHTPPICVPKESIYGVPNDFNSKYRFAEVDPRLDQRYTHQLTTVVPALGQFLHNTKVELADPISSAVPRAPLSWIYSSSENLTNQLMPWYGKGQQHGVGGYSLCDIQLTCGTKAPGGHTEGRGVLGPLFSVFLYSSNIGIVYKQASPAAVYVNMKCLLHNSVCHHLSSHAAVHYLPWRIRSLADRSFYCTPVDDSSAI